MLGPLSLCFLIFVNWIYTLTPFCFCFLLFVSRILLPFCHVNFHIFLSCFFFDFLIFRFICLNIYFTKFFTTFASISTSVVSSTFTWQLDTLSSFEPCTFSYILYSLFSLCLLHLFVYL